MTTLVADHICPFPPGPASAHPSNDMYSCSIFPLIVLALGSLQGAAAFTLISPSTVRRTKNNAAIQSMAVPILTPQGWSSEARSHGAGLSARKGSGIRSHRRRRRCRTLVLPSEEEDEEISSHDQSMMDCSTVSNDRFDAMWNPAALASSLLVPLVASSSSAAASDAISTGSLDPTGFVPVCPTSDGFYRILQGSTEAVVGKEAFVEYGPLIAGGLLRIRLELCVVESFVNEAVVPFVKQNGLSWILPLHETVETFLAGVIFALAATFILIGSTKIITIIITYTDFLIGFPCRLLGGFSYDRALGKPVTLDVGLGPFKTRLVGPSAEDVQEETDWSKLGAGNLATVVVSGGVKSVGIVLGFIRELLDGLDVFVGRYLVFWASFYILVKFVHFKVFPDFP